MMEEIKKLKLYIFLFLLTGVLAFYTVFSKKFKSSSYGKTEEEIAIVDTASISRIQLQGKLPVVNLERNPSGWTVNNKYQAREQLTGLLLFGLNKLEVKRPVSENKVNEVKARLLKEGVSISIYSDEGEKRIKVLPNEGDPNSSYYLKEGSNQPYIVFVPGVKGDISGLAGLGEQDWRSRSLFRSSPRSLQSIKVSFYLNPSDGFEISPKNGIFEVKGLADADSGKIHRYVMLYSLTNVDKYITENQEKIVSQLKKTGPIARVLVDDIVDKQDKTVDIYKDIENPKRFYGIISETDELVSLNGELFNFILVKKSYFQKTNKAKSF